MLRVLGAFAKKSGYQLHRTRQQLAVGRQNKSLTNGSPFPGNGGDIHLVTYPNLELTRRNVKQPLTQYLRLSGLAAAVIEGGVQRRQAPPIRRAGRKPSLPCRGSDTRRSIARRALAVVASGTTGQSCATEHAPHH